MAEAKNSKRTRPPVVAIVGHIDHGKSTLLDYIRKTNIVEGEAGGITQRLSAYEVEHTPAEGGEARRITFLDTPGHAAFQSMRLRGLEVADVAILVVSAEEGVKPQTVEAVKLIKETGIPYIVALTKIDKPSANITTAQSSLIENEIYIEGMGGDVPWVGVSSKKGDGIPELLDLILLAADLQELTYDDTSPAAGSVIESHVDPRKGISATLILRDGALKTGLYVVAGDAFAPVRIMENFRGTPIKEAEAGSAVRIVGFSSLPATGSKFLSVENKKQAEALATEAKVAPATPSRTRTDEDGEKSYLPLVLKAEAAGSLDAIDHELAKIPQDRLEIRIVARGVGTITESDVKMVSGGKIPGIVVGFGVGVDARARSLSERDSIAIGEFDIIYKLAEWIAQELIARTPKVEMDEVSGTAKILKIFSEGKGGIVLGGRVTRGTIEKGARVKIMRGETEVCRGELVGLQAGKSPVSSVEEGSEFGAQVKIPETPQPTDTLVAYSVVLK